MPSQALLAFDNALGEVRDLGRVARPSLSERTDSLRIARAVGRAQVFFYRLTLKDTFMR